MRGGASTLLSYFNHLGLGSCQGRLVVMDSGGVPAADVYTHCCFCIEIYLIAKYPILYSFDPDGLPISACPYSIMA